MESEMDEIAPLGAREEQIKAGTSELQRLLPDVRPSDAEKIVAAILKATQAGENSAKESATNLVSPEQSGIRSNCFDSTVSRWVGEPGLRISAVTIEPRYVEHRGPCTISVEIKATTSGTVKPVISILIMNRTSFDIGRLISPPLEMHLRAGECRTVQVRMDEVYLLPRDYIFSVALFGFYDFDAIEPPIRHEILSRSFRLDVVGTPTVAAVDLPGKAELLPKS